MLGEGYDHVYLSVAAIFRPFRHPLPYAQFIGRILRIIPLSEATDPRDNIGQVVSHKLLYLDDLWKYYKTQIQESEVIKTLEPEPAEDGKKSINSKDIGTVRTIDISHGKANEVGDGTVIQDTYLKTELIAERNKKLKEEKEKIKQLQEMLNIDEVQAKSILTRTNAEKSKLKRPDIYFIQKSKDIDNTIKETIVPELIVYYKINKDSDDLKKSRLFNNRKYNWVKKTKNNNAGLLAIYINVTLNLLYSPIVTPFNLLENAKLDNYEYVNYYKGTSGLIAEMKCTNSNDCTEIYYYYFDSNDFLQEIYISIEGDKHLIYSRDESLTFEQHKYLEDKVTVNKVG